MEKSNNYSTFYDRFLSKLVDSSLFTLLFLLVLYFVSASSTSNQLLNGILDLMIFFLFASLAVLPIEAFLMTHFGGTFGKILTSQKIVKSDGKYLSFWESIFRLTVGYVVSGAFFGLGYWYMFRDEKKRTWHDLVSKTVVTKKNKFTPVIGILIFFVVWSVNIGVFSMTVGNVLRNSALYADIYDQVSIELNLSEPSPTPDPNLPVSLKNYEK